MDRKTKIVEMLEKNPEDSFLQHALALEFMREQQFDQAISTFEKLLNQNPSYTGSYYHLGALYVQTGSHDKAIQTYEKGMRQCLQAGEHKAYNEIKAALLSLKDEDDE